MASNLGRARFTLSCRRNCHPVATFIQYMRVKVNGQDAQLEAGTSLERLVSSYRLKPEQIVIELNRKVPAKAVWATTLLAEGDEVEIVKFLGGG
jgi:sulfur carrier protein